MFGKSSAKTQATQSIIGVGTVIVGDINFSGGLQIYGIVQGNIKAVEGSENILVVSEQAKIDGEIHAAHLIINGELNGPVYATQLIELQSKARVKGDVVYNAIEMHHGAVVSGMLRHHAQPPQLSLPSPTSKSDHKHDTKTEPKSDNKTDTKK